MANSQILSTKDKFKNIIALQSAVTNLSKADKRLTRLRAIKDLTKLLADIGYTGLNKQAGLKVNHNGFEMKRLDHGELSIPNRTKNIDADLDKYLADKAKADKREREDKRFLANERHKEKVLAEKPIKEQAWILYKKHGTAMIKEHCTELAWRFGDQLTRNINPRDFLRDEAKHSPKNFLKILDWYLKTSNPD